VALRPQVPHPCPSGWALMKFGVRVHSEANLIFVCVGPNITLVLNEAQI
jgi:hypothetical protein